MESQEMVGDYAQRKRGCCKSNVNKLSDLTLWETENSNGQKWFLSPLAIFYMTNKTDEISDFFHVFL